jgi:hypothetical protein
MFVYTVHDVAILAFLSIAIFVLVLVGIVEAYKKIVKKIFGRKTSK